MGSSSSSDVVIGYVQACAGNTLPLSECGPVWQLGIIAVLVVMAAMTLVLLRTRPLDRLSPG